MTVSELKRALFSKLCDVPSTEYESYRIIEHFTKLKREQMLTEPNMSLPDDLCQRALLCAQKRVSGNIPLSYVLGESPFWGMNFYVSKDCLIPRSDSEFLVEYALRLIKSGDRFADLCTGSGCLAVSVLKNSENTSCTAIDISQAALEIARKNADRHGVQARLELVCDDVCKPRFDIMEEKYDLLISNPPYIRTAQISGLDAEVQKEPRIALDGGKDGLDFYRAIATHWIQSVKKGGHVLLEAGYDTTKECAELFSSLGFECETIRDFADIPRVVHVKI